MAAILCLLGLSFLSSAEALTQAQGLSQGQHAAALHAHHVRARHHLARHRVHLRHRLHHNGSAADPAISEKSKKQIEGVIEVIDDIVESIKVSKTKESENYAEFERWCTSQNSSISQALSDARDTNERLEVETAAMDVQVANAEKEIADLTNNIESAKVVIDKAETIRGEETDRYDTDIEANRGSLDQVIEAIRIIGKVQNQGGFLQNGLLQHLQLNEPGESSYALGIMKGIKTKLERTRAALQEEEEKKQKEHDEFLGAKKGEVSSAEGERSQKRTKLTESKIEQVELKRRRKQNAEELATLEMRYKSTTHRCATKKAAFAVRQQEYEDERKALGLALEEIARSSGVLTDGGSKGGEEADEGKGGVQGSLEEEEGHVVEEPPKEEKRPTEPPMKSPELPKEEFKEWRPSEDHDDHYEEWHPSDDHDDHYEEWHPSDDHDDHYEEWHPSDEEMKNWESFVQVSSKSRSASHRHKKRLAAHRRAAAAAKSASDAAGAAEAALDAADAADVADMDAADAAIEHVPVSRGRGPSFAAFIAQMASGKLGRGDQAKEMVRKLIGRLQDEQAEEDAKFKKCGADIPAREKELEDRSNELTQVNATIVSKQTEITTLGTEVDQLEEKIQDLLTASTDARKIRKGEHEEFERNEKDRKLTIKVLKQAMAVLKRFYSSLDKTAAKTNLLQRRANPDAMPSEPPETWTSGQSTRKSVGGATVLEMLDKVWLEIKAEDKEEAKDEADAVADHEKMQADLLKEGDNYRAESTEHVKRKAKLSVQLNSDKEALQDKEADQQSLAALLLTLHEDCDSLLAMHKQRKTARDFEVSQLKDVMDILAGANLAVRTSFLDQPDSKGNSLSAREISLMREMSRSVHQ